MPLRSIESRRLYRQIADQLRHLIAAGEFPAGDRLPAERDLAQQLRVSPSTVRALIAPRADGTDTQLLRQITFRRQPVARRKLTGCDEMAQLIGDLPIQAA